MYVLLSSSNLHQYYIWCPLTPFSATHSDYYCQEHQLPSQGSVKMFKHINRQTKSSDFEIGHSSDSIIWFSSDHNEQCQHDSLYIHSWVCQQNLEYFLFLFIGYLVLKNNLKLSMNFMETHSYKAGVKNEVLRQTGIKYSSHESNFCRERLISNLS